MADSQSLPARKEEPEFEEGSSGEIDSSRLIPLKTGKARGGRLWLKRSAFWLILLFIALFHSRLLWETAGQMCDDAMISARYARNLAFGQGLRYNRGPASAEPVEGYSNFLWVLLLAGGERLRILPRLTTAFFGGLFSLACIIILGWRVRSESGSSLLGLVCAFILASHLSFALWAMRGLETAMFAAFSAAALLIPGGGPAYILCLLAALARPDGVVVFFARLVGDLWDKEAPRRKILAAVGAWFLLPFAAYTAWRWIYFGSLLPNVFYAKTGYGSAGLKLGLFYVAGWAKKDFMLAGLFALALILSLARVAKTKTPDRASAALFFVILYFCFMVYAAGDFMPDHRFVMHALPLVIGGSAILLYGFGGGLEKEGAKRAARAAVVFLFLAAAGFNLYRLHLFFSEERERAFPSWAWHRDQAARYGRVSSWLLRHSKRSDVIACGDIGYIGYVTDVDRILDTNGLVEPYLARLPGPAALKTDPDYVFRQKPRFLVVMVHYFKNRAVIGHSEFDRAALSHPALEEKYALAVEVPGWRVKERSWEDGAVRESEVRFRVYELKRR